MILTQLLSNIRLEIQDIDSDIWTDEELVRSMEKSVALMSRLLPKRSIAETTLVRTVASETLTISSDSGTLAYKPLKEDSLNIPGKVKDTDYRLNYLTGVVTEIGSNLPDTDYTVSYELDTHLFDLSSILTDYVKIERVEYPLGSNPAFELWGTIIVLRTPTLTHLKALRVIYLTRWAPPTTYTAGDFPTHLDDTVIIGSSGQALIYKAEKYMHDAATALESITTILAGIDSLSLAAPSLTAPTAPTINDLTPPTAYTIVKPTAPTFGAAPTAPTDLDISEPTAPNLSDLTPPTSYTVSKPSAPTLPTAPTAPTPPTLSFTAVETALDQIIVELTSGTPSAESYLEAGDDLINVATRGESVGQVYGQYAAAKVAMAQGYANEALARLRQIDADLAKYAGEVTAFGSESNAFANETSGVVGKYRGEIEAETLGIRNVLANNGKYQGEIAEESMKIALFQQEINNYLSEVGDYDARVRRYGHEVAQWAAEATAEVNMFDVEVRSETAGINEYMAEVNGYSAEIAEEQLHISLYEQKVRAYQIEVADYEQEVAQFTARASIILQRAAQIGTQVAAYLDLAGRYLASGQAKINEFLASLGLKVEFHSQKSSAEQRS